MKIALFTDTLPSSKYLSGVSIYSVDLTKGLIKAGHEVVIFAPKMNYLIPKELSHVKIIKTPAVPTFYPNLKASVPFMSIVLKDLYLEKPDIVHLQSPSFLGMDGVISSRILKIPTIATFHTMFTDRKYIKHITKIQFGLDVLEKISWGYHRWFYNLTEIVTVSTPKLKEQLVAHGFDESKIIIAPVSVDLDHDLLSSKEKKRLKEKYKLKEKVAIYLGRVSQEKGLDKLLQIWKDIAQQRDDVSLLIIGDGPYKSEFKKLISRHKLTKSVRLTGAIDHYRLMNSGLLGVGDIFVSTSQTETFGLSGLEAMAHGLPVVLIDAQGLCEFIGNSGIICPVGNNQAFKEAILTLFDDNALREEMSRRASQTTTQFNSKNTVTNTVNLYKMAIKSFKNQKDGRTV